MNRLSTFIINQEEWSEEMTIEELNEELINACKTGDLDLVKKSIKNGADVFYEDIHENNAIEIAGKNGHIDIVKYLISIGCDPTISDNRLLKEVCSTEHLEIVKYLISIGCDPKADNNWSILLACRDGRLKVIKYLISIGCDPTAQNNWPIILAFRYGHLEIVKYLISVGCDVSIFNPYMKKEFDYYIKYKQIFDNCLAEIYGNPVLERTKTEIDISFQEFKKN